MTDLQLPQTKEQAKEYTRILLRSVGVVREEIYTLTRDISNTVQKYHARHAEDLMESLNEKMQELSELYRQLNIRGYSYTAIDQDEDDDIDPEDPDDDDAPCY